MTLTFLELYNSAASQEWSKYNNDAVLTGDFEKSLVIDLNKAITEILYSYPFHFRERTHVLFTVSGIKSYAMPSGLIQKNENGDFNVRLNSKPLKMIKNPLSLKEKFGIPDGFYIRGSQIILYPTPSERFIVTIDYLTLAVGETNGEEEIFAFENYDDRVIIPEHVEEIFKSAVISRAMLNSIASESDENYTAYKKQSETAYRQLVKYSKGVGQEKKIKM